MTFWEAILYGVLQGLTEFLPISSSGHLAILENLFGLDMSRSEQLTFNVLLHVGSLSAVLIYYRKDVWQLILAFFRLPAALIGAGKGNPKHPDDAHSVGMLLCAMIPLLPFLLLKDRLASLSGYPGLVGICFLANAILLFVGDTLGRRNRDLADMRARDAAVIGLFQCAALMPGISRSGSTVTGALFRDFDRESAVRFSFLLSIPVIFGAFAVQIPDFVHTFASDPHLISYLIGAAAAAVTGLLSIRLLEWISKYATFRGFSVYCALLGIITLFLA